MSARQPFDTNYQEADKIQKSQNPFTSNQKVLGVDGKFAWPIRIFTPILFACTLLVNYLLGINRNKQVSDYYSIWTTPPSLFFTIWAVIYAGLIFANIYNLIKNVWNLKTHIYFGVTNALNIIWTIVFDNGSKPAVFTAAFILIALTVFIFFTWSAMGQIPEDKINVFTYILRNCFAFYLGWCIAASNINFGINIVYWWNATKQTQMIVFWVMTPLCAVGTFAYICWKQRKYGVLSSFCVWLSVIWAFVGAAISSHNCLKGEC